MSVEVWRPHRIFVPGGCILDQIENTELTRVVARLPEGRDRRILALGKPIQCHRLLCLARSMATYDRIIAQIQEHQIWTICVPRLALDDDIRARSVKKTLATSTCADHISCRKRNNFEAIYDSFRGKSNLYFHILLVNPGRSTRNPIHPRPLSVITLPSLPLVLKASDIPNSTALLPR